MNLLDGTRLSSQAIGCLLLGLALLGSALWAVWTVDQQVSGRARKAAEALNAVMGATVLRRNLNESLGLILTRSAESLQATSGTLHLASQHTLEEGCDEFRLVYAIGVEHLDWVTQIASDDPLIQRLTASANDIVVTRSDAHSPWVALTTNLPLTLLAVRFGGPPQRHGLMVLSWPRHSQAEANMGALQRIGEYTRQVLAEYEDIAERARELQAVSAELQRQDALHRTAAHDIGNQLALVVGPVSLLASERELVAEHRAAFQSSLQQLMMVRTMLDDLIQPDRAIEPTRVPVEGLIELLGGLMSVRLHEVRSFVLDVPTSLPDIWCERIAALRVFDNLLTNAIRHNSDIDDLQLWIRARLAGSMIEFEVGDSGQGIPPEAHARLFEFGCHTDSTGRIKGHGMGLWSCCRIVEAHGGRIWVVSTPGQGAQFFFTLPIVPITQPQHDLKHVDPAVSLTEWVLAESSP